MNESEIVVVGTLKCNQNSPSNSFQQLGPETTRVHIHGYPFLWAIKLILQKAPNLRTIQVIPPMIEEMRRYQGLCQEHEVKIIEGRLKKGWGKRKYCPKNYQQYREFFFNLKGRKRDLFRALILMGFKEAIITSRYLCLKGEGYLSQRVIAQKYSLYRNGEVSRIVKALIHYFDPSFKVGKNSEATARQIAWRIKKIKSLLIPNAIIAERLNMPRFPDGLSLSRLDTYKAVLIALRDGRIATLEKEDKRAFQVLSLRFGLADGICLKLQEIAGLMGFNNITRPRQLEMRALKKLSIKS